MKQKHKQFLVLGLGRFGRSVAIKLTELGHEVLAVDSDQAKVDSLADQITQCVCADCTDEDTVKSFDPAGFDAAIVGIGTNVRDSVMTALLCKEAGAPLVIAKAMDELHGKLLTKIGVDRVIYPERDMGERLAHALVSPSVLEMMNLSGNFTLAQLMTPSAWENKTLSQLNVRKRYHVSVIAIHRGNDFITSIDADTVLRPKDMLVVTGGEDDLARIED